MLTSYNLLIATLVKWQTRDETHCPCFRDRRSRYSLALYHPYFENTIPSWAESCYAAAIAQLLLSIRTRVGYGCMSVSMQLLGAAKDGERTYVVNVGGTSASLGQIPRQVYTLLLAQLSTVNKWSYSQRRRRRKTNNSHTDTSSVHKKQVILPSLLPTSPSTTCLLASTAPPEPPY